MSRALTSCDTFVAFSNVTKGGCVIFGKNADRPNDEVQEVLLIPAADHEPGSKVQCTYIEIDQVPHTHSVILSKPAWMWGAEMGSNQHGVCIGNEAVWTKLNNSDDKEEKLLGMDLVRLTLERCTSAREGLDILTNLLSIHGHGGPSLESPDCIKNLPNARGSQPSSSFLICGQEEAWLIETAGKHWAAENIKSGVRNISNQLTIRTKIDAKSEGLEEFAKEQGWWDPSEGPLDFAKVFSDGFEETELKEEEHSASRQLWGTKLMRDYSKEGEFSVNDMLQILRHEPSGICMTGGFLTTGSQVSILPPVSSQSPCIHYFTATPNPAVSLYKPFIFCEGASLGDKTISPTFGDKDPAKVEPRFQSKVDRKHALWREHEKLTELMGKGDEKGKLIVGQMLELEKHCVSDMEEMLGKSSDEKSLMKMSHVFKHMVDLEINFYK